MYSIVQEQDGRPVGEHAPAIHGWRQRKIVRSRTRWKVFVDVCVSMQMRHTHTAVRAVCLCLFELVDTLFLNEWIFFLSLSLAGCYVRNHATVTIVAQTGHTYIYFHSLWQRCRRANVGAAYYCYYSLAFVLYLIVWARFIWMFFSLFFLSLVIRELRVAPGVANEGWHLLSGIHSRVNQNQKQPALFFRRLRWAENFQLIGLSRHALACSSS